MSRVGPNREDREVIDIGRIGWESDNEGRGGVCSDSVKTIIKGGVDEAQRGAGNSVGDGDRSLCAVCIAISECF